MTIKIAILIAVMLMLLLFAAPVVSSTSASGFHMLDEHVCLAQTQDVVAGS